MQYSCKYNLSVKLSLLQITNESILEALTETVRKFANKTMNL